MFGKSKYDILNQKRSEMYKYYVPMVYHLIRAGIFNLKNAGNWSC